MPGLTRGGEKHACLPQKGGPGQADALQFMILQAASFPSLQFNIPVVNASLGGRSMPVCFWRRIVFFPPG